MKIFCTVMGKLILDQSSFAQNITPKDAMTIQYIVEQALKDGYLTPSMETEVGRICDSSFELSIEEYMALDRLMEALLTGEVVAMPRKQFINVMEELVIREAINRVAQLETGNETLEVGDIAAYALNRLPPLYATTEEGATYQRQRVKQELQQLIGQQIEEAIHRYLARPDIPGQPLKGQKTQEDILKQMNSLLKSYAPNFEQVNGKF